MEEKNYNNNTSHILLHEFIKCSRLIFSSFHGHARCGCGQHHGHGFEGKNSEKAMSKIGQGRLLAILLEKNGISQKELSEQLNIAPASVSELINKLENGEFIEKKQNEEDKRVSNIFLTEGGKFFAEKMQEGHNEMAQELFSALSEDEQKQLIELLKKLITSFKSEEDSDENFLYQHKHHRHFGCGCNMEEE